MKLAPLRVAAGLAGCTLAFLAGCGSRSITSHRVEQAVAPTFANLIHTQESLLGLAPVGAASLRVTASCRRTGLGGDGTGGGPWTCVMSWFVPGHAAPFHERYELSVTMDGCYTATTDGGEGHVGSRVLPTSHGPVVNLLYAFDGCFDTT